MPDFLPQPRPMSNADWTSVESAYAHSFSDCRSAAVWDWRFQRRMPMQSGWRGWICPAPDGDDVAAFSGGSMHRGWLAGSDISIVLSRDSFTHPSWRALASGRRGLFARTEDAFHQACKSDATLCLGIGLDRRVRLGALLGISTPYPGGQWYRQELERDPPSAGRSCTVLPTDFHELHWSALWQLRRSRVRMSLVRDTNFLAWRFADQQGRTYWRFGLYGLDSQTPLGYLVLTMAEPNRAILVDAILPESTQQARDGLRQINRWLVSRGVRWVDTFCGTACPEFSTWPTMGFRSINPPLPVMPVYRIYDASISDLRFVQDYAFTLADSDLY
jgi:hypothetical protein